jgi:hypothetical protein
MDRQVKEKIGKFKIGDLVTLSAYGAKTEQNSGTIHWLIEGTITYAMIVGFDDTGRYPIQVEWIGKPRGVNIPTFYYHRELKYYRGA